jgi:hypothetical protein
MEHASLLNVLKHLGSWHAFAVALTLSPLAVAIFLYRWAPSIAALSVALAMSFASGMALGGALRWCAETALPRRRAARSTVQADTALVAQLRHLAPEEKGVLGAFLASGRQERYLDVSDPAVRELRERGLLVRTGPTLHRVPDAIWRELKARPDEFPAGVIPSPRPDGWMAG